MAIILLLVNTVICIYFIYKKNAAFLAFAILYQEIQIIIFNDIGLVFLREPYYVILVALYIGFNFKNEILKSKLKYAVLSPISVAFILLSLAMLVHVFVIGIFNEGSLIVVRRYFLQVVPVMLLSILFLSRDKSLKEFANGIIIYGAIFIITGIFVGDFLQLITNAVERSDVREEFGVNPIQISRLSGLILIVSLIYLYNQSRLDIKICIGLVSLLSLFLLVLGASRGPLLALLLSLSVYYIISINKSYKGLLQAVSGIILASLSYYIFDQLGFALFERLEDLSNYENMLRYVRLEIATDMLTKPDIWYTGLGPHGFANETGLNYPHNIIAEFLVEYGIIGFISLSLLLGYGGYYSFKLLNSKHSYKLQSLAVIWIYYFLAAMVSGNIIGNRNFFFLTLVLASINYVLTKKNKETVISY